MKDPDLPQGEETRGPEGSSTSGESASHADSEIDSLAPILRDLPEQEQKTLLEVFRREPKAARLLLSVQSRSWRGPLPHPDDLGAFGTISADFPDRIVKMAEREQLHRHRVDDRNDRDRLLGVVCAFVLALLGLVGAFVLVLKGHSVEGSVLGGATLVMLVGTFIQGRHSKHASIAQRAKP